MSSDDRPSMHHIKCVLPCEGTTFKVSSAITDNGFALVLKCTTCNAVAYRYELASLKKKVFT